MAQIKGSRVMAFLLTSPIGNALLGLLGALAVWGGLVLYYENKGAAKYAAKVEQRTVENVRKADKAEARVRALPSDGLRDKYRRD